MRLNLKKLLREAQLDRAGKPIRGFQPGDMWREDFDYIGMLKFGASLDIPEGGTTYMSGVTDPAYYKDILKPLYESFTDVNYHREAQDLGNAIDYIEDAKGIEDLEKAVDFLEKFKKKCAATLDVMKVKWTPRR
tara:strand:+ start:2357 stop:2758 length:402 start_codon:yes stop_codon:yes gene_type:complete